ncbi:MAG: PqqD family protein [Opitutae bacterium]|nr:PqqD family protein [Opitutae bacterium]
MSPQTVLSRNPETIATEIDGEVVLMSLTTGRTFGLDKRGSAIWALIEQPRTVAAVVAELIKAYNVTAEQCQADVMTFVGKLVEAQLASVKDPVAST